MEIEIDLWALVEEMLPGLLEIERIEAMANDPDGLPTPTDPDMD